MTPDPPPRGSILVSVTPDLPAEATAAHARVAERDWASSHDAIRDRYDQLFAGYKKAIGSREPPDLVATTPAGRERVVLDDRLWETLFDIYAYHGWDGVRTVEDQIRAFLPAYPMEDSRWAHGWRFFLAVRRLLAEQVAAELAQLEFSVTTRVAIQLPLAARAVQAAIDRYGVSEQVTRSEGRGPSGAQIERRTYAFGSVTETQALVTNLRAAVTHRAEFEAVLQRIADIRAGIQQLRPLVTRQRMHGRREKLVELKIKEIQAVLLEEHEGRLYRAMRTMVDQRSPLGLLALEGLRPGFATDEMVQLLGSMLYTLRDRIDALAGAVDTGRSRVREVLRPEALDTPDQPRQPSSLGPERLVIDAALAQLGREQGFLPVVHEQTLHTLVETDAVPRDSFAYVVWARYVLTLTTVLDERRANEATWQRFWSGFAKGASALSVALLVTPAAEVSPVVRGAAVAADLALLAHTVSSVTGQLALLDQLQDQQLLGFDAFSVEGLSRLGELGAYRREMVNGITQQLLVEVLLLAAGARWPAVKRLLLARGLYIDLQTILE